MIATTSANSWNIKALKPSFRQEQTGRDCSPTTKRNIDCDCKWNSSLAESKNSGELPLATTNWPKLSWPSFISSALSSLFNLPPPIPLEFFLRKCSILRVDKAEKSGKLLLNGYEIQCVMDETEGSRLLLAGSGDDLDGHHRPSATSHQRLSLPRRPNQNSLDF